MRYTVILPLPPTLNQQIDLARTHWSKSAKVKKIWTKRIASLLYDAPQFEGAVWQKFTWFVTFRNDSGNVSAATKYIDDALVDQKVIKKDNLTIIQSPVLHYYIKRKKGEDDRVEMIIQDSMFEI